MGICKTCEHWDKTRQYFHDDLYGCCKLIEEAFQETETDKQAYIADCGDGNSQTFHTKKDFGCRLHKVKIYICEKCDEPIKASMKIKINGQWFCKSCVNVMSIVDNIADVFNVSTQELTGKPHVPELRKYRCAAWSFFYGKGYTYQEIGKIFHRHHSVIMRGMTKADPELLEMLNNEKSTQDMG